MRTNHTVHAHARNLALALIATLAFAVLSPTSADASARPAAAKSDCGNGYFCIWSSTNFSGTIQRFSATNSYRAVTLSTTRSYYNNRSYRTWLHAEPNGGGSNLCINPGASKTTTSGWQSLAEAVYLATVSSC